MKTLTLILTLSLLFINIISIGQIQVKDINGVTYTVYTKAQTDIAIRNAVLAQANIQKGIDGGQNIKIAALEVNDTTWYQKTYFTVRGGVVYLNIDSVLAQVKPTPADSAFVVKTNSDIRQLYINDGLNARAIIDSSNAIRKSLRQTDSILSLTRGAMVSYFNMSKKYTDDVNKVTNLRIDSVVQNMVNLTPVWLAINTLRNDLSATNIQVGLLNIWADKVKAMVITFPQ